MDIFQTGSLFSLTFIVSFFFRIATMGMVGAAAHFLFYVSGFLFYFRMAGSKIRNKNEVGKVGLVVYVVFFVAGLTNVNLSLAMYVSVFALINAALLSSAGRACFAEGKV